MTSVWHVPSFVVNQKLAMTTNRYEIRALGADGTEGDVVAVAQQKRMALKERVTFFRDDSRAEPVFSFAARSVVDLGSGYDVTDAEGTPVGSFRKDFGKSLLRTTFHVEGPGYAGSGQERSQAVSLLRRFTDVPFLRVHFDFVDGSTGAPLLSTERRASVRDRYTVQVPDERVDVRLAASVAVALDALLDR